MELYNESAHSNKNLIKKPLSELLSEITEIKKNIEKC